MLIYQKKELSQLHGFSFSFIGETPNVKYGCRLFNFLSFLRSMFYHLYYKINYNKGNQIKLSLIVIAAIIIAIIKFVIQTKFETLWESRLVSICFRNLHGRLGNQ